MMTRFVPEFLSDVLLNRRVQIEQRNSEEPHAIARCCPYVVVSVAFRPAEPPRALVQIWGTCLGKLTAREARLSAEIGNPRMGLG